LRTSGLAEAQVQQRHPAEAIRTLQSAARYEFGWRTATWSNYVRGQAYRQLGQPKEAAAEFQKVIAHRGICLSDELLPVTYVLAELEQARACSDAADKACAKAAYQTFLEFWKNADATLPTLREARAELARLN
jgi:tetratricopeptide (TPR) repeat protein